MGKAEACLGAHAALAPHSLRRTAMALLEQPGWVVKALAWVLIGLPKWMMKVLTSRVAVCFCVKKKVLICILVDIKPKSRQP